MEQEKPRPNWAHEIDSCRPERIFEDPVEAVVSDIEAMNQLPEQARRGCTFELQKRKDTPLSCSAFRPTPKNEMSPPAAKQLSRALRKAVKACLRYSPETE